LELVRRRGYATAVGELEDGLHAVAAPVFDPAGRCVAALSVSGPSYRMPARGLAAHGRRCRQAAAELALLVDGSARAA
jgi:DNA-binding IclR family transcriptional regulator